VTTLTDSTIRSLSRLWVTHNSEAAPDLRNVTDASPSEDISIDVKSGRKTLCGIGAPCWNNGRRGMCSDGQAGSRSDVPNGTDCGCRAVFCTSILLYARFIGCRLWEEHSPKPASEYDSKYG
jgi:hypothetical protein